MGRRKGSPRQPRQGGVAEAPLEGGPSTDSREMNGSPRQPRQGGVAEAPLEGGPSTDSREVSGKGSVEMRVTIAAGIFVVLAAAVSALIPKLWPERAAQPSAS